MHCSWRHRSHRNCDTFSIAKLLRTLQLTVITRSQWPRPRLSASVVHLSLANLSAPDSRSRAIGANGWDDQNELRCASCPKKYLNISAGRWSSLYCKEHILHLIVAKKVEKWWLNTVLEPQRDTRNYRAQVAKHRSTCDNFDSGSALSLCSGPQVEFFSVKSIVSPCLLIKIRKCCDILDAARSSRMF